MKVSINSKKPKYNYEFSCQNQGIIGVYGISGSGKSSLLQAIAGFQDNINGSIEFNTINILDNFNKNQATKCSYMAQQPILFPHWTVAQNLKFAQKYSTNKPELCNELIKQLECQHLLEKWPEQLSGGEKQRVAFIRTLIQIQKNTIALFDEPFSALDQKLRKVALNIINNTKNKDCLIFLVTHEISELYQIADELLYINDGLIAYNDSIVNAMSNNYKDLPLASKISITGKKHIIYADDVSICLNENSQSSIVHQIPAIITKKSIRNKTVILKLQIDQQGDLSENQQDLYAKITKDSYNKLKLEINQKIIANFKANAYL